MASFNYVGLRVYNFNSGTYTATGTTNESFPNQWNENASNTNGTVDGAFQLGEHLDGNGLTTFGGDDAIWRGDITVNGHKFHLFENSSVSGQFVLHSTQAGQSFPSSFDIGDLDTTDETFCFAAETQISTPQGATAVESLAIGDLILANDGRSVPVKWIGRQTTHKLFSGPHMQPVRICAGALGAGLPHSDLTVTADHGMVIDGLVINASALVNGTTIDWVPMAELPNSITYYHIETEAHDVILANGAPAETFMDAAGRAAFDNHQEYLDLYGVERIIPEMPQPRINAQRLLPDAIKARLKIDVAAVDLDMTRSA